MCYDKKSSITAYIASTVFSLLLYNGGDIYDKNIALFSLVFIQMQLAEYFMWSDQKCNKTNHYATVYAHIILMLQPLSIILFMILYNTTTLPNIILYISLFITFIPFVLVIINNIKNKKKLCSKADKNSGHLEWEFVNGNTKEWPIFYVIIYYTFLFLPWLFFKNKLKGYLVFFITFFTFLFSKLKSNNINEKFKQWESKWCFISTMLPLIFLLLKIFN